MMITVNAKWLIYKGLKVLGRQRYKEGGRQRTI